MCGLGMGHPVSQLLCVSLPTADLEAVNPASMPARVSTFIAQGQAHESREGLAGSNQAGLGGAEQEVSQRLDHLKWSPGLILESLSQETLAL